MTTPRRTLLTAIAAAPILTASPAHAGAPTPQPANATPSASEGAPPLTYWQRLGALYSRAEALADRLDTASEAAERAAQGAPEDSPEAIAADVAFDRAKNAASRSRALAEHAAHTAARDWPSLSIKLAVLRHSAGADQLTRDEAFDILEADIRHCIAAQR